MAACIRAGLCRAAQGRGPRADPAAGDHSAALYTIGAMTPRAFITLPLALGLGACSNPKAPSEANFKAAT